MASSHPTNTEPFAPYDSDTTTSERREQGCSLVREMVETADADSVVVNLSGGIDSSTTAALAVEALGSDRVYGLVLPCGTATAATVDTVGFAESLGIEYTMMNIFPLVRHIEDVLPSSLTEAATVRSHDNLVARIRMLCAYYAATTMSRLALGTTTRSEWLLGRFTKHGDGGVDLQPLTGLYKTELRTLAQTIDVPTRLLEPPSTDDISADRTDERDLRMAYDDLDELLWYLVDTDVGIEYTAENCGLGSDVAERFARDHIRSQHKRRTPPTPTTRRPGTAAAFFHELELLFG